MKKLKQSSFNTKSVLSVIIVLLCLFLLALSVRDMTQKKTASSFGELQLSDEDVYVSVNDRDFKSHFFRFNATLLLDTDNPAYDDYLQELEEWREIITAATADAIHLYEYEQLQGDAGNVKQELSEEIISSYGFDGFIKAVEFPVFQ